MHEIGVTRTGFFGKMSPKAEVVYFQPRYFDEGGRLVFRPGPELSLEEVGNKHLLKPGDVLFAAKGINNFAACMGELSLPAVASSSFFVISLHDRLVLPEYVAWYLNHSHTQAWLKSFARGTGIVSIAKSVITELEVPIIPLEKQRSILKIQELRNRQVELNREIEDLREERMQEILLSVIR